MESIPIFSNLLPIAFLWHCFLLHRLWGYRRLSACSTPPQLMPPRRQHSQKP
jgi:hypothetical protein